MLFPIIKLVHILIMFLSLKFLDILMVQMFKLQIVLCIWLIKNKLRHF